jgi:hypothetical protein
MRRPAPLGGLPIEVLSPLRDQAFDPETALTALLAAHMMIFWLSRIPTSRRRSASPPSPPPPSPAARR